MSLPLPPRVFWPRCKVLLTVVQDDAVPLSAGLPLPAFEVVPLKAEVVRNDARRADTCRVVVAYRDLPIDPRQIKTLHVAVHMENVPDPLVPLIPSPLNLRFAGVADKIRTSWGGAEEVEIEGRDATAVGLDLKWSSAWPPGQQPWVATPVPPFPITSTLAEVVERIRVLVWPGLKPSMVLDPKAAGLPVAPRAKRNTWTAKSGDSVWDVLCDICALFGQAPVFNVDQLEVRPPLFPKLEPAVFFYGSILGNVEKLEIRRDIGERRSKPVRITAWDPGQGRAVIGGWPTQEMQVGARKRQQAAAGGVAGPATPTVSVEWEEYRLEGTYTELDLTDLARVIWQESAQNDISGVLETRDMVSASPAMLPLLGMSNGDPVVVNFGLDQAVLANLTPPEAVAFLSDFTRPNALRPDIAKAVVDLWLAAQAVPRTFLVRSATHSWDNEDGYRLKVEFCSYFLT